MAEMTAVGGSTGTPSDSGDSPAERAKDAARSVAGTTASEARAVVGEAKDSARDLIGDARSQLREQAGDQAQRLAGTLRTFGEQLSSMAQGPHAQGTAADLARQAGDRTQQVAHRIETGGLDAVVGDAKRLARNRPGAFLLGALGAGFVVGRVLKNVDTHAVAAAAKPDDNGADDVGTGHGAGAGNGAGLSVGTSASLTGAPVGPLPLGTSTGLGGS